MAPRTISQDELDGFEIDDDSRLYWRGRGVVLEQRITLKGFELFLASIAALGAFLAGVYPFGAGWGWW